MTADQPRRRDKPADCADPPERLAEEAGSGGQRSSGSGFARDSTARPIGGVDITDLLRGLAAIGHTGDERDAHKLQRLVKRLLRRYKWVMGTYCTLAVVVGVSLGMVWSHRFPYFEVPAGLVDDGTRPPMFSDAWWQLLGQVTHIGHGVGALLVFGVSTLLIAALARAVALEVFPKDRAVFTLLSALNKLNEPAALAALPAAYAAAEAALIALPPGALTQVARAHRRGWHAQMALDVGALEIALLDGSADLFEHRVTLATVLCRVLTDEWPATAPEAEGNSPGQRFVAATKLNSFGARLVAGIGLVGALLPLTEVIIRALVKLAG